MNGYRDQKDNGNGDGTPPPVLPPRQCKAKLLMEESMRNMDFQKLYEAMRCVVCHMIPSPYVRFLCSKGHMLCSDCGAVQFERWNRDCPGVRKEVNEEEITDGRMEISVVAVGSDCKEKIKRYPADPIFSALFLHSTWRCPNSVDGVFQEGCSALLKGENLFQHLSSGECQPPPESEE